MYYLIYDKQGLIILQYTIKKSREIVIILLIKDLENILKVDIIISQKL